MLSNYELSKRAAEAKLRPVQEEQRSQDPPGPCRFRIQPVLNPSRDAGQSQPESTEDRTKTDTQTDNSSDSVNTTSQFLVGDSKLTRDHKNIEISTDNSSDSCIGRSDDATSHFLVGDSELTRDQTKTETQTENSSDSTIGSTDDKQTLPTKDASAFYGSRKRLENLQILAERLTNTVLSFGAEEVSADEDKTKKFCDLKKTDTGLNESSGIHHSDQSLVPRTSEQLPKDLKASHLPRDLDNDAGVETRDKGDQDTGKMVYTRDSNDPTHDENESNESFANKLAPTLGEMEQKSKSSPICESGFEASESQGLFNDTVGVKTHNRGDQNQTKSEDVCDSDNSAGVENVSKQSFANKLIPTLGEVQKASSICESGFETSDDTSEEMSPVEIFSSILQTPAQVLTPDSGLVHFDSEEGKLESGDNRVDSKFEFSDETHSYSDQTSVD